MRFQLTMLLSAAVALIPSMLISQQPSLRPTHLMTDYRDTPMGVGANPVFGWNLEATLRGARNLRQSGYRLRLAASVSDLRHARHLVWDSGRVTDSTFWQRPYNGPSLQSATTYYWQVQSWARGDTPGPWSDAARFTTGLMQTDDWSAHWIAAEPDKERRESTKQLAIDPPPLPVFRHDVKLRKPVAHALLFVSGLGQYEVHLNGHNVTETVLNPGWTNYGKTVAYDTYDVTALLHRGMNAIGVLLGNGMYNVEDIKGHYTKFAGSFGQPKLLLQMEVRYTDGSSERLVSDKSWLTHAGPVLYSSIFGGEAYDASVLPPDWDRVGFRAAGWQAAKEVAGPGGSLQPEQAAPLVIAEKYPSVRVTHPKPGIAVYDLGQNMSGWPEIRVRGQAGASVTLLPGELLNGDGTVSQRSTNAFPADPVLFRYVLRGVNAGENWHPRFSYHSFRYVQVSTTAAADDRQPDVLSVAGNFVHARVPIAGSFRSSDELFGRIHTLIDRAVLSNLASVVTDCPSREKLGWLEQTYLNAATLMLNYDVTGLYEKMSGDIRDAQLPSGLVPSIAPEYVAFLDAQGRSNAFRDSPEWGSAAVLSPWALYQHTGDTRPLQQNYEAMQRYVAFLREHSTGMLLNHGLGDWYDIGPKPPGPSQLTSKVVTATGVFYEDLIASSQIARLLGHSSDATQYEEEAAVVREAYNEALFHPATDQYDKGSQTANALPLALGMVPAGHVQGVLANLVADIHAHQDHVTAGDVGFHYVVRALTNYGRSDVLAAMFSRTDSPSYGYQLSRGATTLTEAWDANPHNSQNHFMLGHGEEWFYRGLAGLSIDMARGPENAVLLTPSFLDGVSSAEASYQAPMGRFALGWEQVGGQRTVDVTVPAGGVAQLALPGDATWNEAGRRAQEVAGVLAARVESRRVFITLTSGSYHFVANDVGLGAGR